jgi:hypothetical protein
MSWEIRGQLDDVRRQLLSSDPASGEPSQREAVKHALDALIGVFRDPSTVQIETSGNMSDGYGSASIAIVLPNVPASKSRMS